MLNCTFSILSPPHTEFHKALKGRIPELLRHPAAAHVVDELFSVADAATRNSMVSEFYGREYRVFEGGELNNLRGAPGSLPQLLSRVDGPKAQLVVRELTMCLLPVLEKRLVDSALVHRVTAELLAAAPATTVADAVASLSGEALLHMAHTRDGATAACAVFAYGSARDRKKAVRALKGHVLDMARDEWGHLVLLTCLSVVDDTSLLRKFIVPELQVGVTGWVSGRSVLGGCTGCIIIGAYAHLTLRASTLAFCDEPRVDGRTDFVDECRPRAGDPGSGRRALGSAPGLDRLGAQTAPDPTPPLVSENAFCK